jgi:hypothetical protein
MRIYILLLIIFCIYSCKNNNDMELKFDKAKLSNGDEIETIDLNDKQYSDTLKTCKNLKRVYNSITINEPEIIIYEIDNGNILVSSDGYHSVYKSLDDLIKVMNDFDENGIEILSTLNKFNENFPLHTKELINELYRSLHYNPKEQLDCDLDALNSKIINTENTKDFNEKNILNYIALIGEIIINEYGGNWEVNLAKDNKTWNPYLIIDNNKIDIISYTYEDMIETDKGLKHLKGSIIDIINSRRLK